MKRPSHPGSVRCRRLWTDEQRLHAGDVDGWCCGPVGGTRGAPGGGGVSRSSPAAGCSSCFWWTDHGPRPPWPSAPLALWPSAPPGPRPLGPTAPTPSITSLRSCGRLDVNSAAFEGRPEDVLFLWFRPCGANVSVQYLAPVVHLRAAPEHGGARRGARLAGLALDDLDGAPLSDDDDKRSRVLDSQTGRVNSDFSSEAAP